MTTKKIFEVKVTPNSPSNEIQCENLNECRTRFNVRVKASPIRGKANSAVIDLLAKELGVPKNSLKIVRGKSSRFKTVKLVG